jgi:hypothetical protein
MAKVSRAASSALTRGRGDALKCISSYIGGKIWKFQEPLVRQQHTPTEPGLLCVNNGIKIHAALSIPRHEPQTHSANAALMLERRRSALSSLFFSSTVTFLQQLVSASAHILIRARKLSNRIYKILGIHMERPFNAHILEKDLNN